MKAHYVQPRYLDVSVRGGGRWTVETPPEATVFVYIVEGEGAFGPGNGTEVKEKNAVLFSRGKGFSVQAAGGGNPVPLPGGHAVGGTCRLGRPHSDEHQGGA